MGFKVQTNSEQTGVPLEKYSNACDILPNQPLFTEGQKEMTLIRREK